MEISEQYEKIAEYIYNNPAAVLGTIADDGGPHGAVVYVCPDDTRPIVYFLTKDETTKFNNLHARDKVSLTIVNEMQNSTLQATGKAAVVHDAHALDMMTKKMFHIGPSGRTWAPPISKINAGKYKLIGITLDHARLSVFGDDPAGHEPVVTEL